jgi:hypothetical protein
LNLRPPAPNAYGRGDKRGPVWSVQYNDRLRKFRESSGSSERSDAIALLRRRVADLTNGRPRGPDADANEVQATIRGGKRYISCGSPKVS